MNLLFLHVLCVLRQLFVRPEIVRNELFLMGIVAILLLIVYVIVADRQSILELLNTEYPLVKLVVLVIQLILV
jgi:hypothetical protein